MNETLCSFEHAVILACRSGQWTEELRAHVSSCSECTDTQSISSALGSVTKRLTSDGVPPHPTLVWIKARLEQEQASETARIRESALRHVIIQFVLWLTILLAAFRLWPVIKGWASVIFPASAFEGLGAHTASMSVLVVLGLTYGFLFWRYRGTFVN